MVNDKLIKINSINDEVNEYHPILNELFKRLPNILNAEYTHGPNEMGADFVLTKHDETLSRDEYIGVIVKVGKIKQNHADIDNQIGECGIERKIEGGKKKIHVTEIWVINNNTISNGAQTKIHHKYQNKNISFVSGEDVCSLIDKHYPEYWTDISVDIGSYLRTVAEKSSKLAKTIELLDTSSYGDTYIPQVLSKLGGNIQNDPGRYQKPKKVDINNVLENNRLIFIEGSMGTGKSKLLEKITEEYSSNESFNTKRTVPYIATIKEYMSDYNGSINSIIDDIDSCIDANNINYLIMLDALDEKKLEESDVIDLLKDIYKISQDRNDFKVVVTSRPYDNPTFDAEVDRYFNRYEIHPLTPKQIVSIVHRICKRFSVQNHLISELEKSQLFKVLPKTPISAIILGKLLSQDIQEVPSSMTELYAKYTELVLGRWDIDRGLQSQTEYDVCFNVTINVARYFLDNELERISINEARDMFDEYVSNRKLKIDNDSVFNKLIYNIEVFKLSETSNTISFVHRTFAEYFYACYLDRDNSAVIDQEIYNVYWNNSVFFYLGIKKDCPELVEAIANIKFTDEAAKVSQMFTNGNLLLAAYLTPYEVIKSSLLKSYGDAAKFFNDVINNNISTPLAVFSRLHLLSIITHTMNSSYGYDFFMDALEEKSLELSCITNPSDVDYIELFLINSTLLSINRFNAFDMMLKKYGKNIPIMLQVGINHCIVEQKTDSPIVKRFIKQHMKSINKNHSLHDSIVELYDNPIDEEAANTLKRLLSN